MYVCVCFGITDHEIRDAATAGCTSTAELTMRTGAGANCGTCLALAAQLIDEVHDTAREQAARPLPLPVLQQAA